MIKQRNANKILLTVERVMEHLNEYELIDVAVWQYDPTSDSFEICEGCIYSDDIARIVMPFKEDLVKFSEVVVALENDTQQDFERYRKGVWHRIVDAGYTEMFYTLQDTLLKERVAAWLND